MINDRKEWRKQNDRSLQNRSGVYEDHRAFYNGGSCEGTRAGIAGGAGGGVGLPLPADCFLAAQGGRGPQLIAHAKGNMNFGNDKDLLIRVVSQCLPYIGHPRSLNAVSCVGKAVGS